MANAPACQLHVLQRHRLLLQAGLFEDLVAVRVADFPSNDATVPKSPDPGDRLFHPYAARLPSSKQTTDDDNLVARVYEFRHFEPKLFPNLVRISHPTPNAMHSDIGRRVEDASSCVDHDFGMKKADGCLSVAAIHRCKDATHD